jgi:hypothetical protein
MDSADQQGVIDMSSIPRSGELQDMGAPVCFIDTEYTTLDPWRRKPWEIAIIRRDPGAPDVEVTFIVTDVDLSDADPKSLDVGGFYQRHPRYAGAESEEIAVSYLPESEVAPLVEALTRGAHIVAAVPDPDVDILRELLRRHGMRWTGHYHLMDIENVALGYLKGLDPDFTPSFPLDSDELSELCGVPAPGDEDRHTAMGDARWVRDWWDAIFS